jgi:hypothetical protein
VLLLVDQAPCSCPHLWRHLDRVRIVRAKFIMSATELIVAVVAEAQPTSFFHLRLRQLLDWTTFNGDGGALRSGMCSCWHMGSASCGQETSGARALRYGLCCNLLPKLQLPCETHGDGQGLWIVDVNIESEGWLVSCREELYTLGFREVAGTW